MDNRNYRPDTRRAHPKLRLDDMRDRKSTFVMIPGTVILLWVWSLSIQAAELTHGPMIGHTTDRTARIWVRAKGPCGFDVHIMPKTGGIAIVSEMIKLEEEDNFCGSVLVSGLIPSITYAYRVFLNHNERSSPVVQEFTTHPPVGKPGIARIGFGHSVRGTGEQTIWRAVAAKKPHLFIFLGDNIYSNSTDPVKQRRMYLQYRADPHFRAFGATTSIYAIWDDHDYGVDASDRTQVGKERSLKTFYEIWPNPQSAEGSGGIWGRFTIGQAEFFLLDVRYHRSPLFETDGPAKTMLGKEQRQWFIKSLAESKAVFKFPVSGSSWNCNGTDAWNRRFMYEYDVILAHARNHHIPGIILLGGDQHFHMIGVRPLESWGGYDLHEWMAGQLWNHRRDRDSGFYRGFGLITVDTKAKPATARLEFFDHLGNPRKGRRVLYTTMGALRALWNSPPGVTGAPPKALDRFRPRTSGGLWEALPETTGETLTENDLKWPAK